MTKKSVFSFLREISIIIIGVLIALFISNWNENRNNNDYVKKAKNYIKKEVIRNKSDLKSVVEKHDKTIDSLYKFKKRDDYSIRDFLEHMEGFQLSELRNTGLAFFVANKAELIDFKTISQLSSMESLSKFVAFKGKIVIDFIYKKMESTAAKDKETLIIHLEELMETEENLLEICNEYLKV
ncbi:hypothetical protein [Polaribacter sp. R77954]|uniref:hypothetical protein n=1 Tax=Polaribacter sp. R77954 TaxID=3093870 RepID=UPI0037C53123